MSHNRLPVGSVTIRTRHKRGGERRAWVKVAEPNVWKLRAVLVWEEHHGPVPRGMVVHHEDGDKLNDVISNLKMMSKAEHLAEHAPDYLTDRIRTFTQSRQAARWSTKSTTKRTGRPAAWSEQTMAGAVADYQAGGGSLRTVAARHGVTFAALAKRVARS
jgi:hypothetical protein